MSPPVILLACAFTLAGEVEPPTSAPAEHSTIKRDEVIDFYPTIGYPTGDGAAWELLVHGCIYEPGHREAGLQFFMVRLGIGDGELDAQSRRLLTTRAAAFLVDHERRKRIAIRLGDDVHVLEASGVDGHFDGRIRLPAERVAALRRNAEGANRRIRYQAVTAAGDARVFEGDIHLIDAAGFSVVSDIDDTIKISEVRDRYALLRNTFLRPYRAVEAMAEVYAEWAKRPGVSFHYVSASPWQLFRPLRDFLKQAGFPDGALELKRFRWTDSSFFNLFASPEEYKPAVIAPLLERVPGRRFVLVGDSGEKDPEIYAALARRYPNQVVLILIRDVTGEGPEAERYRTVFAGLPPDLWRVFINTQDVREALPAQ